MPFGDKANRENRPSKQLSLGRSKILVAATRFLKMLRDARMAGLVKLRCSVGSYRKNPLPVVSTVNPLLRDGSPCREPAGPTGLTGVQYCHQKPKNAGYFGNAGLHISLGGDRAVGGSFEDLYYRSKMFGSDTFAKLGAQKDE